MRTPSFLEGVVFAALAALGAALGLFALDLIGPRREAFVLVLGALGLAYLLYLLARAPERAGRVVAVTLWALATATVAALWPDPGSMLLTQAGLLWLTRALYHQGSLRGALADLALIAAGLAAAAWAGATTGSLFLAVWTGFLVQALFPLLPGAARDAASDPFREAARVAGRALAQLERDHRR